MKKNVLPPETIRYIATLEKQVATQKDLINAQKDLERVQVLSGLINE